MSASTMMVRIVRMAMMVRMTDARYDHPESHLQETSSLRLAFDMLGFNGNDNDNAHCDMR